MEAVEQLRRNGSVVVVGRGQGGSGDYAGPCHAQVQAQPVVGLVRQGVAAEGGNAPEAPTPKGSGKAAYGHGQAVNEGEVPIVPGRRRDVLPERDLH